VSILQRCRMATNNKKNLTVTIERRNTDDSDTNKTPRTARFAEATSVYSPVDAPRAPFDYPTNHYKPQAQVSDVGLSYVAAVEMEETDRRYLPPPTPRTAAGGPLKSALKSPGAPPRTPGAASILSPTFREEQQLEKHEASTDKEQAKDLVSRTGIDFWNTHLTTGRKSRSEYESPRSSFAVSTLLAV
jgi:hypothetical protein